MFLSFVIEKEFNSFFEMFFFFNVTVDLKIFPYHAGKHSTVIVIFLYWNYLMGRKFKRSH